MLLLLQSLLIAALFTIGRTYLLRNNIPAVRLSYFSCIKPLSGQVINMSTKRSAASSPAKDAKKAKPSVATEPSSSSSMPYVPSGFQISRAKLITQTNRATAANPRCVIYWMSRDQRVNDNHALHYAQSLAIANNVPLRVVFNLVPRFLEATLRQYGFMLKGLQEVETTQRNLNIPFHLLMGDPLVNLPSFAMEQSAAMVVSDFSPLRVGRSWVAAVANKLDESSTIPLVQVDAHNIVPCWVASDKLEYSARTFRGKITPKIPEYLREVPPPVAQPAEVMAGYQAPNWETALASLEINRDVPEVDWLVPGPTAALQVLREFIENRLKSYSEKRNDPNQTDVASNLSPYLHFGQISAERIVWTLKHGPLKRNGSSVDSFLEELVVRRELTDNFCYYNPLHYDSLDGCYDWAKTSLQLHSTDPRPILYNQEQLEQGKTQDDLWNAAQLQMVREGKMHGFLRMYWAKKILEWTASPAEALHIAIYLNDKYNLDGRDPNGYVGCMWSIGGIHDQGWGERAIFGKIRYMNYEGCKRKFDVAKFVRRYPPAAQNAATAKGLRTLG